MNRSILAALLAFASLMAIDGTAWAVEPSGPYPTWDDRLAVNQRFQRRFIGPMGIAGAYLDRETGLVWTMGPRGGTQSWFDGFEYCARLRIGDRGGWRLPSIEEIKSLIPLPAGHPFRNATAHGYWSATSVVDDPAAAYAAGDVPDGWYGQPKTGTPGVATWCVRGARGIDPSH